MTHLPMIQTTIGALVSVNTTVFEKFIIFLQSVHVVGQHYPRAAHQVLRILRVARAPVRLIPRHPAQVLLQELLQRAVARLALE